MEQRPTDNGYRGGIYPLLADDFEQPLQVPIWRSLRKRHTRGHYRIAFPRAERDLLKVASNAETVGQVGYVCVVEVTTGDRKLGRFVEPGAAASNALLAVPHHTRPGVGRSVVVDLEPTVSQPLAHPTAHAHEPPGIGRLALDRGRRRGLDRAAALAAEHVLAVDLLAPPVGCRRPGTGRVFPLRLAGEPVALARGAREPGGVIPAFLTPDG